MSTFSIMMLSNKVVACATVLCMAVGQVAAQSTPKLLRVIDNPVASVADNFGRNIMVTPDGLILCGAAGSEVEGEGFSNSGVAYLIKASTGEVVATMPNPEPDTNVGFGAFSWAGDTKVIVSAIAKSDGATTASGRVYVFNLADGAYARSIHNPTPGSVDWFGYGLGMQGDLAIIGAPGDDTAGTDSGAVYLFNTHTGALVKEIPNPDPTGNDGFGYSVAGLGNNRIAVGAPATDDGAADAGAVFILNESTGAVIHKIVHPEPEVGGFFGFQVRAHGGDVLIGAPASNKAYLYDSETGTQLVRMVNPDIQPEAFFGSTVGSAGNNILVGNPLDPVGSRWVGRAHLFNGNNGNLLHTFDNPTPEAEDRYGVSVAGYQGNIIISADQNRVNDLPFAGSIYVYSGPLTAAGAEWTLYE